MGDCNVKEREREVNTKRLSRDNALGARVKFLKNFSIFEDLFSEMSP